MSQSPPNGTTVHHTPNAVTSPPPGWRTKPYDATVAGGVLTVVYVNDGDTTTREYDGGGDPWWFRSTGGGGVWRRRYTPASPPTVPPSGTYTVDEFTTEPDAWTQRESGAYTTGAT